MRVWGVAKPHLPDVKVKPCCGPSLLRAFRANGTEGWLGPDWRLLGQTLCKNGVRSRPLLGVRNGVAF